MRNWFILSTVWIRNVPRSDKDHSQTNGAWQKQARLVVFQCIFNQSAWTSRSTKANTKIILDPGLWHVCHEKSRIVVLSTYPQYQFFICLEKTHILDWSYANINVASKQLNGVKFKRPASFRTLYVFCLFFRYHKTAMSNEVGACIATCNHTKSGAWRKLINSAWENYWSKSAILLFP